VRILIPYISLLLIACQPLHTSKQQQGITQKSVEISEFASHWITPDTIMVAQQYSTDEMTLTSFKGTSPQQIKAKAYKLTPKSNPQWLNKNYPHLSAFNAYSVDIDQQEIKELLKKPLIVFSHATEVSSPKGTYLQTTEIIDALYTSGEKDANEVSDLGAVITGKNVQFKLWAPTAKSVSVLLFEQDKTPAVPQVING
jgi:pullulanase